MVSRASRTHTTFVLTALLFLTALALVVAPSAAHATTPGSGSWYWPVGTEDFHGWDGWWVYRPENRSWHMAQDMPAPVGSAVYAIGDGVVLESEAGKGYGGVLVILHKNAEGGEFKAVYGHIRRAALVRGSHVRAGQLVGRINSDRHLHFGIHPGRAYPSDRNPYRGHTYVRTQTYGWVDAVKYLRSHPRVLAYKAPPLPIVATVETTLAPTFLGTADGTAYWSVEGPDGPVLQARSVCGTQVVTVPDTEALPSLDTTRYVPTCGPLSFTLKDRAPVLRVAFSTRTPLWDRSITVSGSIKNAAGSPFVGASVVLERSIDGGITWSRIGTRPTSLTGAYSFSYVPTRSCALRVRFTPPSTYLPVAGSVTTTSPRPGLRTPDTCTSATAGQTFTVAGLLYPRHAAGTHTVALRFQRYVSGTWREEFTASTTNRDSGSGTRYARAVRLNAGTWRVRAETPADSLHASAVTGWHKIAVR